MVEVGAQEGDGPARQLRAPADLPLGAYADAPRRVTTLPLPHAMLLYTDGLVERRERHIDEGISELLAALSASTADELCNQATAALYYRPAGDDVALIAIRRTR